MLKIWQKFKKFIRLACTFTGGVTLAIVMGLFFIKIANAPKSIRKNSYLTIDLNKPMSETENSNIINDLTGENSISLLKLLQTIEYASQDENIIGLVVKINKTHLEPAQIQDVARAVSLFKLSGKKTVVFSQGFGDFGRGNMEYYLASFFDEIYMQPHTYIGLTGINIEVPFAKDFLDKIGIYPEFYTRYEYKNAMASFTDFRISKEYSEQMKSLGNSLLGELKLDITNNRKLNDSFESIINKAPLSAIEGKKLGLVDEIMYQQQLEQKLKKEGAEYFVDIKDYASELYPNEGNLPTVAVLNLDGEIVEGRSEDNFNQSGVIGSQSVVENIENIKELSNLKAVVVRINSPGGSYNASDEIYFALQQLKVDKKVPIIVSQSAYAASGGYFISLAGDYIFAEPMTITGSIGVLGGKVVFEKLWKKLGVNWSNIALGKNAGILSPNHAFSAEEKKIFNASLDEVYLDFITKVKENRKLTESIDLIARGRVWTGRQAQKLGLIDDLGGFSEAVVKALKAGKVKENQKIKIVSYPKEKSFGEKISALLSSTNNIKVEKAIEQSGVDITNLKLFKRLQYDTVLLPFKIEM